MARYERFSLPPRSVSVPGNKPRLTMMDRQIAALRMEQEREKMQIKTREELFQDLTNFGYVTDVDEYGLPLSTPYQVPDSIPDVLPLPEENKDTKETKNSVKTEDPSTDPKSGTE